VAIVTTISVTSLDDCAELGAIGDAMFE